MRCAFLAAVATLLNLVEQLHVGVILFTAPIRPTIKTAGPAYFGGFQVVRHPVRVTVKLEIPCRFFVTANDEYIEGSAFAGRIGEVSAVLCPSDNYVFFVGYGGHSGNSAFGVHIG